MRVTEAPNDTFFYIVARHLDSLYMVAMQLHSGTGLSVLLSQIVGYYYIHWTHIILVFTHSLTVFVMFLP